MRLDHSDPKLAFHVDGGAVLQMHDIVAVAKSEVLMRLASFSCKFHFGVFLWP